MTDIARSKANPVTAALPWLIGAIVFFAAEGIAAAAVTPPYRYSYARDYISQLCVPGWTGRAAVMNVGLCVQGVVFLVGAVLAARASVTGRRRLFVGLAALYGCGVVVVGAVPIGPSAPILNLTAFHATGTLVAIVGGNAAVLVGSSVVGGLVGTRWYRPTSVSLGVGGFVSYLILHQPAAQPALGVWERGSVYSVILWQALSAILLLSQSRRLRAGR